MSESVEKAIAGAPCVFFIDELDSFSKRSVSHRNSGYVAAIVNSLLEHLTRLNNTAGVIVLGATNLPENVDLAIIRPGRFDRHTALENPDRAGIKRIFEIELGASAQDLDLAAIADRLLGMSGAQVAAVVRDARGQHAIATRCWATSTSTQLSTMLGALRGLREHVAGSCLDGSLYFAFHGSLCG